MWTILLCAAALATPLTEADLEARLLDDPYGPAAPLYGPAAPAPEVVVAAQPVAAVPPPVRSGTMDGSSDPLAFLESLPTRAERERSAPGLPWWVPILALGGAAVFYGYRRFGVKGIAPSAPPDISVTSRAVLGGGAGVAVVEVQDGPRRRRLLIGTGDKHPVLLTELSTVGTKDLPEPQTRKPAARTPSRAASSDWLAADTGGIGPRKAAARVLLDEAMHDRRRRSA